MTSGRFDQPRSLKAVLGLLSRGSGDPTFRWAADGSLWMTGLVPEPFSLQLRSDAEGVDAQAFGDGAPTVMDRLASMLGALDDPAGFVPTHPLLEKQWRRYRQIWRIPRTLLTWQIALAAALEQRVTGVEARGAWRALIIEYGSPAPGAPKGMWVPPTPKEVLQVPSWDWRRYGVDRQRIETIREIARCAHVLARAEALAPADGRDALLVIPGVGPWTAAEISCRAFGDADAVSVGDYHLGANVTYALSGRTDGDDATMLELLGPYVGHRQRVVRLIEMAGVQRPRRGPRMRLPGPRG